MSRIIEKKDWTVKLSESIIGLETVGGGSWPKWDRYLTIDGKKAYHIGNICGTCNFFFERLGGANQSVSPQHISEKFKAGLINLDDDLLIQVSKIMPNGDYVVALLDIYPSIVSLGGNNDYFTNEQVKLWGVDGFWGMPHYPKIRYYRGEIKVISEGRVLYEFFIPMFPQSWLDKEAVEEYQEDIGSGSKPTAIALSVLDIKEPADWEEGTDIHQHWCLAHYIIDGHHKIYASALNGTPIRLLSFLAINEGVSGIEDIEQLYFNAL